jgi:peptidoglycan-N-acetylglucosamine deacetylase
MRKVEAAATAALVATVSIVGALAAAMPARAGGCPGNPDAIGTSRVIAIKYGDYTKLGRLQYPQTLPLADHEVVLTFDDGPMRLLSDKALDILNSQCVRVTYFLIGQMAHYFPDIVRREYASGDVIGTHSEHHPLPFNRLSDQQVQQEIDEGIASVGAALGDPKELAPFFRIPGFGRSDAVEEELAKRKLIVFSTDVVADDWLRYITPAQIVQRAISRLEKRGRGILLLHDIHPATVLALADLLKQLKVHGFHIVQVVPAGPGRPETPVASTVVATSPKAMLATTLPDVLGIDHESNAPTWPASSVSATSDDIVLAAPDATDYEVKYAVGVTLSNGTASASWPRPAEVTLPASAAQLSVPSLRDIDVSMNGQTLVGVEIGMRPNVEVPHAIGRGPMTKHNRMRHVRLRGPHGVRRAKLDRQHADLFSRLLVLASAFTPRTATANADSPGAVKFALFTFLSCYSGSTRAMV